MPGDLRVSLRLTAEDLMSPQIVEALSKLQILEQQTARINGQQAQAAGGANAHAAAQAELAEKAGLSARALEVGAAAGKRFGEEMLAGAAQIGAGLIGFELIERSVEKVVEAEREAEVVNRQLTARFGAAAGEYRDFAEQAAAGTNFTAVAFERASATLQPLIRDYGLTDEELRDLVRTTADLAAANGVPLVQAATDVMGVMRGMTRAGQELGLNLKAEVIQGMDGLSAAEKRAALEGDNVASAHARLKVIQIDAAAAQGQAAEAAGETGDQFAKLDKATSSLWETMGESHGGQAFAATMGTAATSLRNLILLQDRLRELNAEGKAPVAASNPNPTAFADWSKRTTDELNAIAARVGIPNFGIEGSTPATPQLPGMTGSARTLSDEQVRLAAETKRAMEAEERQRSLEAHLAEERGEAHRAEVDAATRYAAALESAMQSANDALARHADGIGTVADAWERVADGVAKVRDNQLKSLQGNQSQIDAETQALVQDRAFRRRLGLPELSGETDLIRQLYKTGYQERLAQGPAAMQAALAHLRAGDWDPQRVQIERQDVVATNVYLSGSVQGGAGGGGQQSSISGGGGSAARYAGARSNGPAYQSGLGRFGQ